MQIYLLPLTIFYNRNTQIIKTISDNIKLKITQRQMDNFYQKGMYDICQLIINQQFKRAANLCQFLIRKGFRTNQLFVTLSYSKKMLQGPEAGLQVLRQYSSFGSQQSQEIKNIQSPLIEFAASQYLIESQNLRQSLNSLQTFDFQEAQGQNQSQLIYMLKSLKNSYSKVFLQAHNSEFLGRERNKAITANGTIVQTFTQEINQVTSNYMNEMSKSNQSQQNRQKLNKQILKYGQFYLQYDDIKQRILTILSDQLKHESKKTFNVSIRKNNSKISHNNFKSPGNQIKKQSTRLLIFKQAKPQSSLQKNQTNKQKRQNRLVRKQNLEDNILSGKNLNELKMLLKTVNNFILFFKNKLTSYQSSKSDQDLSEKQQNQVQQQQIKHNEVQPNISNTQ